MYLKFFLPLLLFSFLTCSFAEEQIKACANYQASYGWSEGYEVDATVLKGTELNSAIGTFDYTSYATYVVIFWGPGQATIIEMDLPYVTALGTEGTDQEGTTWQVAKTSYCY